jgi:putative ABC transport system ATP-binding protein
VDLSVEAGAVIAIVGVSGSGKTTLLNCLCGLTKPDSGSVSLDEIRVDLLDERALRRLRLTRFGFVFQFSELLPELSIVENVELPLRFAGDTKHQARTSALETWDVGRCSAMPTPAWYRIG